METVLFAAAIGVVVVIGLIISFRSWRRGEGFRTKTVGGGGGMQTATPGVSGDSGGDDGGGGSEGGGSGGGGGGAGSGGGSGGGGSGGGAGGGGAGGGK